MEEGILWVFGTVNPVTPVNVVQRVFPPAARAKFRLYIKNLVQYVTLLPKACYCPKRITEANLIFLESRAEVMIGDWWRCATGDADTVTKDRTCAPKRC